MIESTLLIAFVSFIAILLVVAVILRKMSVRDIFDDVSSPIATRPSPSPKLVAPQIKQKAFSGVGQEKNRNFNLDRKTFNIIGKTLGIIGMIMLFAPLPESFNNFSLGMAFLGYLLAKATAPPKKKNSSPQKNSTEQKLRLLAGKPEYDKALKLLYSDYNDASLVTEEEKYRRALRYLQTKGISQIEAKENLMLLLTLLIREKSKGLQS